MKFSILIARKSHRSSLTTSDRERYFILIDEELTNSLDLVNPNGGGEGEEKNSNKLTSPRYEGRKSGFFWI
jgi:hypothetical protein